jgi:hypothetical protein
MLLLDKLRCPTETLALGALLHDVAKPLCQERKEKRIGRDIAQRSKLAGRSANG